MVRLEEVADEDFINEKDFEDDDDYTDTGKDSLFPSLPPYSFSFPPPRLLSYKPFNSDPSR